jgi:hypothetical protein
LMSRITIMLFNILHNLMRAPTGNFFEFIVLFFNS